MIDSAPPVPAPASSPVAGEISRRHFFRLGAAGAAVAGAPLAARGFGSGFTHGVASGEPGSERVLLWTRYVAGQDTRLEWEVSETPEFSNIVSGGSASASATSDFCVKAWAGGLSPGRWYYYRFTAPDGSHSDIGRTRTMPQGPTQRFRMAVFSCSNYGFGLFNAYGHAVEVNDADIAVHLGDYIYEYARGTYPSYSDAHPERGLWPANEAVTLADYRLRYATYRTDPDLRRLHQSLPMISVWDDHESSNDAWLGGAENHQSETEGPWDLRKAAVKRAYREWMPVSDDPYAAIEVGDLATLFKLDTRLEGREEQFNLGMLMRGADGAEGAMRALAEFRDGAWRAPDRQLLGLEQDAWLARGLGQSRAAGKTWQVLVQQVLMGSLSTPPALLDGLTEQTPAYIRGSVTATALAGSAGLPSNMDAWDGYPAARARVLESALGADANLLVLAGDTHNAWAFELDHEGTRAGIEFGVQSVASPGLENSLPGLAPSDLASEAVTFNSQLKWADTQHRGYALIELTPERASAEYRFMSTIRTRNTSLLANKRISSHAGSHALEI